MFVYKVQDSLKPNKNEGHFTFMIVSFCILLKMRKYFGTNVEEIKACSSCLIHFFFSKTVPFMG